VGAYRYRDRLGERERYLATANYFMRVRRDRAQAAVAPEALLARDSVDDIALNNFGDLLMTRREFVRAESLYHRAIVSGRAGGFEYAGLVTSRLLQGRIAAAETAFASARAAFPQHTSVTILDPQVLYARGKLDSAAQRLSVLRAEDRDAGNRAWDTRWLADLNLLRGRVAEGERLAGDATAQDLARAGPTARSAAGLRVERCVVPRTAGEWRGGARCRAGPGSVHVASSVGSSQAPTLGAWPRHRAS
jgi:hypothetical protein